MKPIDLATPAAPASGAAAAAPLRAVNWNRPDDDFTATFWSQNLMQFWTDEEIPLSDDKMSWMYLNDQERDTYMKVLGGLTLLDTVQGGVGMPSLVEHVEGLQRKAVLGFMGMMEQIHAKSYSSIFTTLASTEEIDAVFRWVEKHPQLQKKLPSSPATTAASSRRATCTWRWPLPCCSRATCSTAASSTRSISPAKAR